jgi:hypothetical protein
MLVKHYDLTNFDPEAQELWDEYAEVFEELWGINRVQSSFLGGVGKALLEAEFREHGDRAFELSVAQPFRNAYYMAASIHKRWAALQAAAIEEPILDYGCGIGFTLVWLAKKGYKNLYGYDVPGPTRKVMLHIFKDYGIQFWDDQPVKTILCINVLEHLPRPAASLNWLRQRGRVLANICVDDDAGNVASREECLTVLDDLKARGEYLG